METEQQPQPWHQMPGEPDKHFRMFDSYLGSNSSYDRIARSFSISKQTVNEIARKWQWQKRKDDYEDYKRDQDKHLADEARYLEEQKFQCQLDLARLSVRLTKECLQTMENMDENFKDPDIPKKMAFIRQMTSTIKALLSLANITIKAVRVRVSDSGPELNLNGRHASPMDIDSDDPDMAPDMDPEPEILELNAAIIQRYRDLMTQRPAPPKTLSFNAAANIKPGKPVLTKNHEQQKSGTNGTNSTNGTVPEQRTTNNDQRNSGTNGTENPETNDSTVQPNGEQRTSNNEQRKCYQKQKKTARHKKHH